MTYNTKSSAILVAIAAITLALVTAASFTHYSALAASKKSSGSSKGTSSESLSSKDLKSFISCITTANNSRGLTHKIVTSCLDTVKGIPPASPGTAAAATTTGAGADSSAGSISPGFLP